MLRFNAERMTRFMPYIKFQYILCYGSTLRENSKLNSHIRFQYILCYGSTLFCFLVLFGYETFQYILCYGSTGFKACDISATFISIHPMLRFNYNLRFLNTPRPDFNTSYVTVQLDHVYKLNMTILYFNTSYVTVQLGFWMFIKN